MIILTEGHYLAGRNNDRLTGTTMKTDQRSTGAILKASMNLVPRMILLSLVSERNEALSGGCHNTC